MDSPASVRNIGHILLVTPGHRLSHADNIVLNDPKGEMAIMESVKCFANSGGGCLVENSTLGLNRKSDFMLDVCRQTGVQVVAGTGYYVAGAQDQHTLGLTTEQMAE